MELNEDNLVPLYYSVSSKLTDAQVNEVIHALSSTPVAAAIVTDAHDVDLALKLSGVIIQRSTLMAAEELARTFGEPTVIVNGGAELEAHYPDGHTEAISIPGIGDGQPTLQDGWSSTYGGDGQMGINR